MAAGRSRAGTGRRCAAQETDFCLRERRSDTGEKKKKGIGETTAGWFLALHLSLVVNSIQGVFSKLAGREKAWSGRWILYFFLMFLAMLIFALAWQQILKHMSLTFAFTNKPITIVWGLLWGVVIFGEHVTWNMIVGSLVILIGIMIGVSGGDGKTADGTSGRGGTDNE